MLSAQHDFALCVSLSENHPVYAVLVNGHVWCYMNEGQRSPETFPIFDEQGTF